MEKFQAVNHCSEMPMVLILSAKKEAVFNQLQGRIHRTLNLHCVFFLQSSAKEKKQTPSVKAILNEQLIL